jgi:hypothetical protein
VRAVSLPTTATALNIGAGLEQRPQAKVGYYQYRFSPSTGQSRALVRAGNVVELPRRIVKVRDSGAHDAANAASLAIIVSGHDTVSASKSYRGFIVRVSAYSQIVHVVPQSGPSELTVSPQLLKRVS